MCTELLVWSLAPAGPWMFPKHIIVVPRSQMRHTLLLTYYHLAPRPSSFLSGTLRLSSLTWPPSPSLRSRFPEVPSSSGLEALFLTRPSVLQLLLKAPGRPCNVQPPWTGGCEGRREDRATSCKAAEVSGTPAALVGDGL